MILQNSLYTFTELQPNDDGFTTDISLNAGHEIFEGHFPEQPILPGACMIQMVKEIAESYTGSRLQLLKADNIKFLSFVDPSKNSIIRMEIKIANLDDRVKVDAQLLNKETVLFKFKGTFVIRY